VKRLAILEDRKKEIIGEIRRSDESKYDHRLHGILLVANGLSPYRVSEVMGDSPKSVENWVNSFLKDGSGSLREPRRPGRPTRLSEIMDSISLDLRKNPMDLGYSQNLWDGKLLSHHLSLRYSVDLGTRQCQRIFRKLGFRLRKPRPKIAKGDSSHKEKFKKNSGFL
jgi:transposase